MVSAGVVRVVVVECKLVKVFKFYTKLLLFVPGYFCVYQDQESFEYIRGCAEKTLLSSLEQEDKLPFQVSFTSTHNITASGIFWFLFNCSKYKVNLIKHFYTKINYI